ncbi:hypothetical protein NE237_009151 [Protea cynaroides]|uniref:Germin-like protein n=1 Tax=Protea cynaroides TaxID=273540 RepID=A0A9Q0KX88_9MAGN|nr:hypothetical protein NE237_009151 [Protea cynaroides]
MAKSLVVFAALALIFIVKVHSADPELVSDFAIPDGIDQSKLDGAFFTYTGLRGGAASSNSALAGRMAVTVSNFPALNGMGVSMELLEFPAGAVNVPHTHPRGAEILFVVDGSLTVGSTDSDGKLYKNVLQKGDVFVFPKGMPHYQANFDKTNKAVAVSAFASSNAGTVSIPKTLFGPNMPEEVLAKAFKISADTLNLLKALITQG